MLLRRYSGNIPRFPRAMSNCQGERRFFGAEFPSGAILFQGVAIAAPELEVLNW
jgi:hypothetical protein